MDIQAVVTGLQQKFGTACEDVRVHRGETTVLVSRERVVDICQYLKDSCRFDMLIDICGVDYLGQQPRFQVVYHLLSIADNGRIRLKVAVPEEDPVVPTVSTVWSTADWHERECWDMYGIRFSGHPDLRRILMPDDWEGYPLRKDYPLQGPDREPYQGRVR